jgi:murein DD-endopeptidase / murein LD-carboxypeptidase
VNSEIAARAMHCLGTPFRLHGRTPGIALDCVGLAGFAAGLEDLPSDYTLRGKFIGKIRAYMEQCAHCLCHGALSAGDIVLVGCGPRQQHLMVKVQDGWVHAHAGLGRVVHMAGPSLWPVLAAWRINGE